MSFWTYTSLSAIHIELSSKCNAICPGCTRYASNSPMLNPKLVQEEVTYEQFVKWFPKEVMGNIYNWIICGNYGDPFTCKDLYEILEYICENSPGDIQVNTNGGLRSPELYRKIGELFKHRDENSVRMVHSSVTFSIDGLEETNHIYRRNVRWSKVWDNLMAYVETGATTHWDYLRFKHNIHQVEEAKRIAKYYGINLTLKNPFGVDKTAMPVYNKELKLDYVIEHAFDNGYPAYVPATPDYVANLPEPVNESGCIKCMAKRPSSSKEILEIFVNSVGQVLPCCFVGNGMYNTHSPADVQVRKIQADMGTANDLNHHSLKEILDSDVLEIWSKSWEDKSILTCWRQCGISDNKDRAFEILFKDAN